MCLPYWPLFHRPLVANFLLDWRSLGRRKKGQRIKGLFLSNSEPFLLFLNHFFFFFWEKRGKRGKRRNKQNWSGPTHFKYFKSSLKKRGEHLTPFSLYLENQIFSAHEVFTECQQTLCSFILNDFQLKVMTQFSDKLKKQHFCAILGPFCPNLGKQEFSQKSRHRQSICNMVP